MPASSAESERATCWWCGGVADSREHKFKRRDLDFSFGKGQWLGRAVAHRRTTEDRYGYPNSSRSARLKFSAVICGDCNSRRSQPVDRAYDKFADFFRENGSALHASGLLDWREIFPDEWKRGRDDVLRYWVKHIACRLAEHSVWVHPALVDFMNSQGVLQHLDLRLEIRDDIAAMEKHSLEVHGDDAHGLWIGDFLGWANRGSTEVVRVESHWGLGWLRLVYAYDVAEAAATTNLHEAANELPRAWNTDPVTVPQHCGICSQ